ncbi:protein kinase domain-containing protein [Pendulispora albinea]|uniref:Protein kinase n=1 Tax=Pendulispora albinea TaxID=2741071 RepID=A0ABZ2LZT1_9BACT
MKSNNRADTLSHTITARPRPAGRDSTLTSATSPPIEPTPGWLLGGADGKRFELLERLGGGGMSVVFLARDAVLDRHVAIKFLINEALSTTDGLERLQLEARACARLNHENIVRLFDMGADRGVPFLVMEHLEGRPLDDVLRDGGVDARCVVRIMIDIAKGLGQAHRAGILHRDLKPSNVFITKDGTAKILDFGVATVMGGPSAMHGGRWGTPRYMSPEQWMGEVQDSRTDLWAAGVVFFELLTGDAPFDGDDIHELRDAITSSEEAPSLRALRPEIPEEAERIAQRAMKKNAAERFGTADELLDALVKLEVALSQVMRTQSDQTGGRVRPKLEMRQVTILSCALDGSPELPGVGLEEMAGSLEDFFDVCTTVVTELEGTVLSLLGPRFLACFGYPVAHEDNAPRALRAASLIIDAMQARGGAKVGVATSPSIATHTERAAQVGLQAAALDLASWLERRAGRGEILIEQDTEALVRRTFELEPRGETLPEGKTRAVRHYRVLQPKITRFDAVPGDALTPLVGRERELQTLQGLADKVKSGKGQFVSIVGEAGIGKSRIVAHYLERTAADSPHEIGVVRCQCWPHLQNSALEPILEGLLRKTGFRRDAPADAKIALLEGALTECALSLSDHVPLLARVLGIPTGERYPPLLASPALLRKRLQSMLVTFLEHMAAREPLVLIVEDAHWSDTSSIDLLDVLLGRMVAARLLVIVTARPEFHPPWPRCSHLHRIALERLSPGQTGAMIAFTSQGRDLPAPLVEQLVHRTEGVPLFVEELTRSVAEALHDARERGHVSTFDAFASGIIPATLEGVLRARLGALPMVGQDVARVVAVLGPDATYDVIGMVSGLEDATLRIGLMQLVETGILRRQAQGAATAYAFKHALVREAAYQSLVKNDRRHVHLRAADVLVEHFPSIAEQNPEIVATHFMEAGHREQAVTYFEKAGARAAERLANADAATHYERAIAQLQMLPESESRDRRELALQLSRGIVLIAAKGAVAPEVQVPYARVRELAPRTRAGGAQPFQSMFGLSQFYLMAGHISAAADIGRELVALADQSGYDEMRLLARAALGPCLTFLGDFAAARECLEVGLGLYDIRKHRKVCMRSGFDPGVSFTMFLGWVLWFLGEPDRAIEQSRAAVALARRVEHPFSLLIAMNQLGSCHAYRGEYDLTRRAWDECCLISEQYELLPQTKVGRGWSRMATDVHGAVDDLEEGLTDYRNGNARAGFTVFLAALAEAQWRSGAWADATRTLDEMESAIATTGERQREADLHRFRGEVALSMGADTAVAREAFERGLAVARRQRALSLELRVASSYARLLMNQSRAAEARELLAPVLARFTEGFDTLDVRQARELLARL